MIDEDKRILMWLTVELEGNPLYRDPKNKTEQERWLQNRSFACEALKRVLEEEKRNFMDIRISGLISKQEIERWIFGEI